MRKSLFPSLFVLLLITLMVFSITGCEADEPEPEEVEEVEEVEEEKAVEEEEPEVETETISFVAAIPLTGINEIIANSIRDNVYEYTGGKIDMEFYFDGVLGGEMEHLEMLRDGEIELGLGFIHDTRWSEPYAAHHIPFLFPSYEAVIDYLHHPEIHEARYNLLAEEANFHYIDTWSCGPRRITSNVRFTNVEEMQGLRIRMPELPLWIGVYEHLGADPTPIPAPDIFESLEAGIIEAQENWISNIEGRRMDEAQDYIMTSDHQVQTFDVLANLDWYNSLDSETQEAFDQAIQDACAALPPHVEEENEKSMANLEERGMEVVEVDGAEFREAAWEEMMRMGDEILEPLAWEIAQEIVEKHTE